MLPKRNLLRVCKSLAVCALALFSLAPTCDPSTPPVPQSSPLPINYLCAYWEKGKRPFLCDAGVIAFGGSTSSDGPRMSPKQFHERAKSVAKRGPYADPDDLSIYIEFGKDTGREGDPDAVAEFFASTSALIDYVKTSKDDKWKERCLKRMTWSKDMLRQQINQYGIKRANEMSDALSALEKGLKDAIAPDKAEVVAQLDRDRKFYDELTESLSGPQTALERLIPELNSTFQHFKTFKAGETALYARLIQLSTQASAATIEQLAAVESQLFALERSEYTAYSGFFARVLAINARLRAVQTGYDARVNSGMLMEGMVERALRPADLVSKGVRTLANMAAYAQARDAEMSRAVADLIRGCGERRQALIIARANEATRKAFASAAFLAESTKFLDQANQRIAKLLGAWPKSSRLKLPLYSDQHDEFVSFLQLESTCQQVSSTSSTWMQTGCNAYSVNFDRARSFLSSLPNLIKLYSVTLRENGAPESLLTRIQSDLTAGKLRDAVSTYDSAVRLVDGS
jgi:hypothetical protein